MFQPFEIVFHYILIQGCIILFFLPFFVLYKVRSTEKKINLKNISDELEGFFLSKESNYLVMFWAMGEALVWFVIPEFLLLLIVFMKIKRKKELLIYDVAGTVAGTAIAFFFHFSDQTISRLPYIQPKMVEQTLAWYENFGIWGLLYQPFSGVPYKVFTLTANRFHYFILTFIVVAVLIRMSRYIIFFGLFVAMYPGLHKFVHKHYVRLFFIVTLIFTILLLRVVHNYN